MIEESNYIDDILETLAARLRVLEVQAATYGIDTPPHIVIEIEALKDKIEATRMGARGIITEQLLARMEPNERWKRLYDAIWDVSEIVYALQKNSNADRLRIQSRHTEFNTVLQRTMIEAEYYKRLMRIVFFCLFFSYLLIGTLFYLR